MQACSAASKLWCLRFVSALGKGLRNSNCWRSRRDLRGLRDLLRSSHACDAPFHGQLHGVWPRNERFSACRAPRASGRSLDAASPAELRRRARSLRQLRSCSIPQARGVRPRLLGSVFHSLGHPSEDIQQLHHLLAAGGHSRRLQLMPGQPAPIRLRCQRILTQGPLRCLKAWAVPGQIRSSGLFRRLQPRARYHCLPLLHGLRGQHHDLRLTPRCALPPAPAHLPPPLPSSHHAGRAGGRRAPGPQDHRHAHHRLQAPGAGRDRAAGPGPSAAGAGAPGNSAGRPGGDGCRGLHPSRGRALKRASCRSQRRRRRPVRRRAAPPKRPGRRHRPGGLRRRAKLGLTWRRRSGQLFIAHPCLAVLSGRRGVLASPLHQRRVGGLVASCLPPRLLRHRLVAHGHAGLARRTPRGTARSVRRLGGATA